MNKQHQQTIAILFVVIAVSLVLGLWIQAQSGIPPLMRTNRDITLTVRSIVSTNWPLPYFPTVSPATVQATVTTTATAQTTTAPASATETPMP
ncbi:MAG: hypothetical protein AAF653_07405 [Chloroflexota bacterium]